MWFKSAGISRNRPHDLSFRLVLSLEDVAAWSPCTFWLNVPYAATLLQCSPGGCQASATRPMLVPPRSRAENGPALRAGRPGHGEDRAHKRRGGNGKTMPAEDAFDVQCSRRQLRRADRSRRRSSGRGAFLYGGGGGGDQDAISVRQHGRGDIGQLADVAAGQG